MSVVAPTANFLNSTLFQFFIAISFGVRVLLAQHWPITSEEAQWVAQLPFLMHYGLDSLLLLRWAIIFSFFVFLVIWGRSHRDLNGKLHLLPLILLHFFPTALFSGAALNIFPLVGILFYVSLNLWESEQAFGFKKSLVCGFLLLICCFEASFAMILPGFLFLELRRHKISKFNNEMLWALLSLLLLYFLGHESPNEGPLTYMPWGEWAFLFILGLWAFVFWLSSDHKAEPEGPYWAYFVIPLAGMCFCAPHSSSLPVMLVLLLSFCLSWLHQSWLKYATWRAKIACVALGLGLIYYPSSPTIALQTQRFQQFSEFKNLALKTPEALEKAPKLLLCDDPQLANVLALVLRREVLVYPSQGINSSYKYLGDSGVWIHRPIEAELRPSTPHLEGLQEWKGLSLGGNTQAAGYFIFEKFDSLNMPF